MPPDRAPTCALLGAGLRVRRSFGSVSQAIRPAPPPKPVARPVAPRQPPAATDFLLMPRLTVHRPYRGGFGMADASPAPTPSPDAVPPPAVDAVVESKVVDVFEQFSLIPYRLSENRDQPLGAGFREVEVFVQWHNFVGI